MTAHFVILGCGNAAGVPAIGNQWGQCDPGNPLNKRTRPSAAVVTDGGGVVIIDTGPDFRDQYNRENLGALEGVIYTHAHADHVHGIDDLRTIYKQTRKTVPVYGDNNTLNEITRRYDFVFQSKSNGFYPAVCAPHEIKPGTPFNIGTIECLPFEQDHGTTTSLGLRFGTLAYSTDVKRLDDKAYAALRGVDTWIVDAAAYEEQGNPVHMNIAEVLAANAIIGARQVYLTHLPAAMDYAAVAAILPPGYAPAHDGLRIPISF